MQSVQAIDLLSYHTMKRQVVSLMSILNDELYFLSLVVVHEEEEERERRYFNLKQRGQLIRCVYTLS